MYERGDFTNGVEQILCSPVEGTYIRPLYWSSFVLSKVAEWIDTAFMIWVGRRPPQFIHLYHHATTFWLFVLIANFPGSQTWVYSQRYRVHGFTSSLLATMALLFGPRDHNVSDRTASDCDVELESYTPSLSWTSRRFCAIQTIDLWNTPLRFSRHVFFHQFNKYFAKRWFKI